MEKKDLEDIIDAICEVNSIVKRLMITKPDGFTEALPSHIIGKIIKKIIIHKEFQFTVADNEGVRSMGAEENFFIFKRKNYEFVMILTECGEQFIICPQDNMTYVNFNSVLGKLTDLIGSPITDCAISTRPGVNIYGDESLSSDFAFETNTGGVVFDWIGDTHSFGVDFLLKNKKK